MRFKDLVPIILVALACKVFFISYSYPYLLHPDESYLLKDPLKTLLLYQKGSFSSTTNLYFWISSFYTGAVFVVGKLFHFWGSMKEFQDMLVSDHANIYIAGRVLSLIVSLMGSVLLIRYIGHFVKDGILLILFSIIIFFNPIEIYSNNWIKFDPFCYMYLAILLNVIHHYFEGRPAARKWLYPLLFAGLALRIDFLALLMAVFTFDCLRHGAKTVLRSNLKQLVAGVFLYMVITFYPLVFIYNFLHYATPGSENIKVTKTFESMILKRFLSEDISSIMQSIWYNLKFYSVECILYGLGPVTVGLIFYKVKHHFLHVGYLFLYPLILLGFLLISSACMPHYSLLITVCLLLISFLSINDLSSTKLRYLLATFTTIFVLSIAIEDLVVAHKQDPRIAAKEYLLTNTRPSQTVAIEKYSMPGFTPPVNECADALKKKAELLPLYGEGTGESFRVRALHPDANCRHVLEIFDQDVYRRDPIYAGQFINAYDTASLAAKDIRFFVTPFDLSHHHDKKNDYFYSYILRNYELKRTFTQHLADPRLMNLYPYSTSISIYEKKKL